MSATSFFSGLFSKFSFSDDQPTDQKKLNSLALDNNDGAIELDNYTNSYMMNTSFTYNSQAELIEMYREVSNYSIVDYAIEDIINETISFLDDEDPITLDLTDIEKDVLSDKLKEKVYENWDIISDLLDLPETIHRRARSFYIDGRIAYQKIVDVNNLSKGLQGVVELDAKFVSKFRNIEYDGQNKTISGYKEYFIYDENVPNAKSKKETDKKLKKDRTFELDKDMLVYVTSGLTDSKTGYAISWLHKAVKPANQLRMMENALVIYRITRAPERRVFYVDTSGMQTSKAREFLNNLKNSYRNRMSFDPNTGTFKDQKHLMTMQEDFWLPRNSNGKGTEVDTLAGGQNLDEIADVIYFQKELYKALNVPMSRLDPESNISFGRQSEISRDELKLSKLCSKIRKRMNMIWLDLLETQLILTKVITVAEWKNIKSKIKFKYSQDLYIEEMKKMELLNGRIATAKEMTEFVGKYFSHDFMRKEVLHQTEIVIKEQDDLITKEKSDPKYKVEDTEQGFQG